MRKIIVSLVLLCMACGCVIAKDIKVTQGDKKFFKTAEGLALLEINWDDCMYDNRESLSERYGDFKPYAEASRSGFIQDFDKDVKHVKITENADKANYKIDIKIEKVDQYIKVTGLIPGPATKIWGTLTISDIKSGEALLTVRIKECDGGASPSIYETFSDSFESLAQQVAKLK